MTQYAYPLNLEKNEDNTITAYFDNIPGVTFGDNLEECLKKASDLLGISAVFLC